MRLGLTLPLAPLDAAQSVDFAVEVAELGYNDFWLAEVGGHDSYALAGAIARSVPGATIGTAVVPAQTRSPMVHAMAAATLAQLTGYKFTLGIGISSENIVRDWAGLPFDRPLRRMREHLDVLQAALSGSKVDYDGETLSMHKYRLQTRLAESVPIYMGALNPGMLRLAGARSDGVILNMVPERAMPTVLGEVRAGAEKAGRDPAALEVVARLHVLMTDDPGAGRGLVRLGFGAYAATSVYNRFFSWIGFDTEAAAISHAWAAKDRQGVAEAMSDEMCDAIAIVGNADELRRRVRAYAEAGVDVCVLNPLLPDIGAHRALVGAVAGCLDDLDNTSRGVVRGTA